MKMIQIQCQNGELFGLDENGIVYVWRSPRDPFIGREPKPIERELAPIPVPMPYPSLEEQMKQQAQREYMAKVQAQAANSLGSWNENRAKEYYEEPIAIGQVLGNLVHNPGCVASQASVRWEDVYIDGCTGGWEQLPMKLSKPVPHPNDPTKCERS